MSTRYRISTTVRSIEFVKQTVRTTMEKGEDGEKKVVAEAEDVGWFVCFEGSWERLFLGMDKPDLVKGQQVEITIQGK
jgi:hypothetical protein